MELSSMMGQIDSTPQIDGTISEKTFILLY